MVRQVLSICLLPTGWLPHRDDNLLTENSGLTGPLDGHDKDGHLLAQLAYSGSDCEHSRESGIGMGQHWTLDKINWERFRPELVDPKLLAIVKTACLIEANADDYVTYLCNVFGDDPAFVSAARIWGAEECQHGVALGQWAERADPGFSFAAALDTFRRLYQLDLGTQQSIRGSRAAELIARQMVETGTSSFYSALRDAADEPVLKEIAGYIAADEFKHYQLFAAHHARYVVQQPMSIWARVRVAAGRFREAEDDELGCAYFAANILPHDPTADYRARDYGRDYWSHAMQLYRRRHVDTAVRMILRAVSVSPNGWLFRLVAPAMWWLTRQQAARLARTA